MTLNKIHIVSAALAAVVAGCTASADKSSAPTETSAVQTDDFFVANGITEVRYIRVAMHIADPKPVTVLTLDTTASRKDELLTMSNVGAWKHEYEDDRVSDGMRWIAEFVRDGKVVKRVAGFNAEPEGLKHLLRACGIKR